MKKTLFILPFLLFFISGCSFFPKTTEVKSSLTESAPINECPVCESSGPIEDPDGINKLDFKSQELIDNKIINTKNIEWNNQTYNFKQTCYGLKELINSIITDDSKFSLPICLGRNVFLVSNNSKDIIIQQDNVQSVELAPVLVDLELIPSTAGRANVLISYWPEKCRTLNYCDVGMDSGFVSHVLDLKTLNFRSLLSFPHSFAYNFKPTWNPAGNKVLFVPQTCGGAGCYEGPLTGYDLDLDKVIYESKEKGSEENFEDIMGNPNHYWKSVRWLSDDKAVAELVAPTGYVEEIDISF